MLWISKMYLTEKEKWIVAVRNQDAGFCKKILYLVLDNWNDLLFEKVFFDTTCLFHRLVNQRLIRIK